MLQAIDDKELKDTKEKGIYLCPVGLPVSFQSGSAFGLATIRLDHDLF